MKQIAILFGLILIAIGVIGYWAPVKPAPADQSEESAETLNSADEGTEQKRSVTALIPAGVGILIGAAGLIASVKPDSTKEAMHMAAGFGLLGAIAATGRGLPSLLKYFSDSTSVNGRTLLLLLMMAVVCWVYVGLSVRSFINVRKSAKSDA